MKIQSVIMLPSDGRAIKGYMATRTPTLVAALPAGNLVPAQPSTGPLQGRRDRPAVTVPPARVPARGGTPPGRGVQGLRAPGGEPLQRAGQGGLLAVLLAACCTAPSSSGAEPETRTRQP